MCTTCGCGPGAGGEPPSRPALRRVSLERNLLARNDALAARNRARCGAQGWLALNLVSSPGAGKTALLEATLGHLMGRVPVAVIAGDPQTRRDAVRIEAAGAPVVQVNTGRGCHLDAGAVGRALDRLAPPPGAVVLIENVGNLVCPALFDLGEAHKVVLLSVTEGEDKPLKYPDTFAAADLLLLTKVDLLPHLRFRVDRCLACVRRVNPGLAVLQVSAQTGQGLDAWLDWIQARRRAPGGT